MMRHIKWIMPGISLLLFIYWYQASSAVLTQQEVDHYIQTFNQQAKDPGAKHDMAALRSFLENDDGKPFYTVNLYKYHAQAIYNDGRSDPATGREAFDHFCQ
jgi:hypothetical protein